MFLSAELSLTRKAQKFGLKCEVLKEALSYECDAEKPLQDLLRESLTAELSYLQTRCTAPDAHGITHRHAQADQELSRELLAVWHLPSKNELRLCDLSTRN
jgi:hypothetical protein